MSKKLIARFLCLSKKDKDWIKESLTDKEAELLAKFCSEAEALGLTKNTKLLLTALSDPTEITPNAFSEDVVPPGIRELDKFWTSVYLSSVLKSKAADRFSDRDMDRDDVIPVSELVIKHLIDYVDQQKCPS